MIPSVGADVTVQISNPNNQVLNFYGSGNLAASTTRYEIANSANLVQYMVLLQTTNICDQLTINFENFDNRDNSIILGDFCGRSIKKCKY